MTFLFSTSLSSFPTLSVSKHLLAFFLPSSSSTVELFTTVWLIMSLPFHYYFVIRMSKIFHLLSGSLRHVSLVRIHLFPSLLLEEVTRHVWSFTIFSFFFFLSGYFGPIRHIELFCSDKYLNLKKNVTGKIASSKVIDPWRNVGE